MPWQKILVVGWAALIVACPTDQQIARLIRRLADRLDDGLFTPNPDENLGQSRREVLRAAAARAERYVSGRIVVECDDPEEKE